MPSYCYVYASLCIHTYTYVCMYAFMYVSLVGSALCLENPNKCKSPGSLCSALPGHSSYGSASGAASGQNSPGK